MSNDLVNVSQVSRQLGLSTRMLHYYEQLGLIHSSRQPGYAYRLYDQETIARLRQIILLRKLRLPLKEIGQILEDPGAQAAIRIFQERIAELDAEREALDTIRAILTQLLDALKGRYWLPARCVLLDDGNLAELAGVEETRPNHIHPKETKTMEELNRAEQNQGKLTNVRIVHLPEATVAAAHYVGSEPEDHAGRMIAEFTRENRLWEKGSSVRLYGFNHPNPSPEGGEYGYEFWVTIPDDMDVPAPLTKKRFPGGTYAAHGISMGNFHEWQWLSDWVYESEVWENNGSNSSEDMYGCLEEHLNYYDHIRETTAGVPEIEQLDLLIPVRKKRP